MKIRFRFPTNINDLKTKLSVPINANGMWNRSAELLEFVIDTVAIQKYVSQDNKTTYSFRVYALTDYGEPDEKYNLVYTKENNIWEQSIIAFKERVNATPAESRLKDFVKLYDSRTSNASNSGPSEICIAESYDFHCTNSGRCASSGQCDMCNLCVTFTVTVTFCPTNGGGPINPGTVPGPSGGSPLNPFTFTPNMYENPVFDDPNYINAVKAQYFFDHLEPNQKDWANQNSDTYIQLIQYQISQNWSQGSKEFALNFINQAINNPELNLDFNASVNSPCFIDMSAVSGNTPEEIKFREVYGILQNSPLFRKLFISLFNHNPLINVSFKIDDLPPMQNLDPDGLCSFRYYHNQLQSCNLIRIDRNHLLTDSNVEIALTIIHEFVHAYLNVKFKDPNMGIAITDQIINNMDFQTCINTYYNSFNDTEAQHNFFVDFLVPTMVNIFIEIKDQLFTPAQISSVENPEPNAVVYAVTQTIPSEKNYDIILPWSWNNYFTHLCYNGLHNCNAYPIIYPNGSPNLLNWIQYMSLATFLLH